MDRLSPLVGRNQKNFAGGTWASGCVDISLLIRADQQGPQGVVVAPVDPVGEVRRRGDLVGRGEQVGQLLFGRHHAIVEFGWQSQAAALRNGCHRDIETDCSSVTFGPLLRVVLSPPGSLLEPDQQMTLDRAFDLLRQGVQIAYPEPEFATKRSELNAILDCSYSHYRTGDEIAAGHLLNEFESGIFKSDN